MIICLREYCAGLPLLYLTHCAACSAKNLTLQLPTASYVCPTYTHRRLPTLFLEHLVPITPFLSLSLVGRSQMPPAPAKTTADTKVPGLYSSENITLDVPAFDGGGRPPPVKYMCVVPFP